MKRLRVTGPVIMIMLFLLPLHVVYAEGLGNARLSLVEGDVQIKTEDSSDWIPASVNMPLREGDNIWVPDDGKAEVQTLGGSQVRLDEQTSLEILDLDKNSSRFFLTSGRAYVNFMGDIRRIIQIDTPVSSVRAYDRAVFAIEVAGAGDTDILVFRGSVNAEDQSGATSVKAGWMLSIGGSYADLAPLGSVDEWERWNMDRDRRFEGRRFVSSGYLPEELDSYASDFDDNGKWVNVRDYGYVWTPTVAVSVGWTPYRHGKWSWIGGDYVWVGYEPWGWAPYHYGRWAFSSSIGWFWVPPARGAVYWGPGFVGWISTPAYVAWVPLAPGEIYYGHGYYGPHSVNIINISITKIVVKKIYRNVYVNNGVTVVHHDTFLRGRRVEFKHRENPFLKDRIHIGRPNIKPERETRMPVIRDIPRGKEPPQRIMDVRAREIKKQRSFVREKEKSVFAPNMPGRELKVKTLDAPKERKRKRPELPVQQQDIKRRPAMIPQVPEEKEKKALPAEKQQLEDKGALTRDRREIKQKQGRTIQAPDTLPADGTEKKGKRQPGPQDNQRSEKLQKPEEKNRSGRTGKIEFNAPAEGESSGKDVKQRKKEERPVEDRQMKRDKSRDTSDKGAPLRPVQQQLPEKMEKQEKRKMVREPNEEPKDEGPGRPGPVTPAEGSR